MEAEAAEIADRAQRAALVAGRDTLRCVLDDGQSVPSRDRHDRVHLAADAGIMHHRDHARARRDCGIDHTLVQVECILADVDKDRYAAAQHECIRGRNEGEGRHDDLVAVGDVEQQRRHVERRRARMGQESLGAAGLLLDPAMATHREAAVAGQMQERCAWAMLSSSFPVV